LHTTFSNWTRANQSYPGSFGSRDFPAQTDAAERDTLGYTFRDLTDSVYHLTFTFPHSEDLTLHFSACGLEGPVDLESWGLDNVKVTVALDEPSPVTVKPDNQTKPQTIEKLGYDPGNLTVEVLPFPEEKPLGYSNPVILKFTNKSTDVIRILKPLDGSLSSWHMPYYQFEVEDENGTSLQLPPRCGISGLWGHTKWPDDYLVAVEPDASYQMEIGIVHSIPHTGQYQVTFSYILFPEKAYNLGLKYPENLWTGHAKSKPIYLLLKKN